jgi:hypothetical protein
MGLAGFYRRIITSFYKIVHPTTSLQNKGTKFEWTTKCEESFHLSKELLISAPILKVVDPNEIFLICTMHVKKDLVESSLIMDISLVMNLESVKNIRGIMPHMMELTAIVHALDMWMNYLMEKKFELRTYLSGLKYLFEQPTLNAKETIWL